MDIIEYILIFTNWNVVGFIIALTSMDSIGFEYVNPCWIYRHYHVNYFGAALLFIVFNLLCPIASFCYWFYKICTFGRK